LSLLARYEHHTMEEPAISCWNVTDGTQCDDVTDVQGTGLVLLFRGLLSVAAKYHKQIIEQVKDTFCRKSVR
jgi:hypothetical protein